MSKQEKLKFKQHAHVNLRRRAMSVAAGASLGGLGIGFPALVLGASRTRLRPTPAQTEGPFYPHHLEGDLDSDLLVVDGRSYARGEPVLLQGRVLGTDGEPIPGALVEIWQCDHAGRYHHPRERGPAHADFQGFGRTRSGADGAYGFRTLRPMPYPGRTPHIHVKVLRNGRELLTTQLYVEGEAGNERDFLWRSLDPQDRAALTVPFVAAREALQARFDIVIGV